MVLSTGTKNELVKILTPAAPLASIRPGLRFFICKIVIMEHSFCSMGLLWGVNACSKLTMYKLLDQNWSHCQLAILQRALILQIGKWNSAWKGLNSEGLKARKTRLHLYPGDYKQGSPTLCTYCSEILPLYAIKRIFLTNSLSPLDYQKFYIYIKCLKEKCLHTSFFFHFTLFILNMLL